MDNWAYVHHYSKTRSDWTGAIDNSIAAPQIWQSQYKINNTFLKVRLCMEVLQSEKLYKNISSPFSSKTPVVLYTMRLRDGRENSLLLYGLLEDHPSQLLDIQTCCPLSLGNIENCAFRVVQHVEKYGGFLVVPKEGP